MIDREFVEQKLKLIKADLEELRREKPPHWEVFLEDSRTRHVTEHLLEHIVNRAIDINSHLLVESGKAPPDTYEDSFLKLAEFGVLTAKFAGEVAKSAGLRNRLIHEYDGIRYDVLYDAISDAVREYPQYIEAITKFIATHK
ncbi:DUF86 domain-containing protein [Candidatus Uhrbacteria bacterium]|nr:DUF86 domain-containing protein [Candidatus Uhrbacteria bacterium]